MSIADYRKFAISLTLAPYFVNIHHLSDTEAYCKIKEWLIRCGKVKNLEPSVAYFDDLAMNVIERARNFQGTLKVKNMKRYDKLTKITIPTTSFVVVKH